MTEERRPFAAVTIDLFGTLVDFRSTFLRTLQRILEDNELIDHAGDFRERWQRFVFQGEEEGVFVTVREDFTRSLERVLSELKVEGDLASYADSVISEMFETLHKAPLFPEVAEVLNALEGDGVVWGVVSNVDELDMRAILRHHGLQPKVAVSSEGAGAYKPRPGPFFEALGALGVEPSEALHAGDSPRADIEGAGSLGIQTVWVNRYADAYPPHLPRPRWVTSDLSPLPRLVQGTY